MLGQRNIFCVRGSRRQQKLKLKVIHIVLFDYRANKKFLWVFFLHFRNSIVVALKSSLNLPWSRLLFPFQAAPHSRRWPTLTTRATPTTPSATSRSTSARDGAGRSQSARQPASGMSWAVQKFDGGLCFVPKLTIYFCQTLVTLNKSLGVLTGQRKK